jgi:hypothetical protein
LIKIWHDNTSQLKLVFFTIASDKNLSLCMFVFYFELVLLNILKFRLDA